MTDTGDSILNARFTIRSKVIHEMVEIPLFAYFLAFGLSEYVYSNLVLYKLCTSMNYNVSECSSLISSHDDNETKILEEKLQPHAAMIILCKSLVEGLFPAALSLFLGPWSDKNGRKPLIYSSLLGFLFYFVYIMGYVFFDYSNPWYLILASVPLSLAGGSSSIITGSFCYISDVTVVNNRSSRMGILEGALLLGVLLGSICSSYLYKYTGYLGVFGICIAICSLGVYSVLFLDESLPLFNENVPQRTSTIFDKNLVIDMIKTCTKPRPNYRRLMIWLIILACTASMLVFQGDGAVIYLFAREKLSWKLNDVTFYAAFSIMSSICGILILSLIQKRFFIKDTVISIVSYFSATVQSIIIIFTTKTWHMYFGASITCVRAISGPINRSILTKIVPSKDSGKVLSLTTSFETIFPLISTPIYSLIYQKTLETFPACFNIFTVILYIISIISILIIDILLRYHPESGYENLSISAQ